MLEIKLTINIVEGFCTCESDTEFMVTELLPFKAALINIFMLTMDEKTMCNVKGVAHRDKPLPASHPSVLVSFSTLF